MIGTNILVLNLFVTFISFSLNTILQFWIVPWFSRNSFYKQKYAEFSKVEKVTWDNLVTMTFSIALYEFWFNYGPISEMSASYTSIWTHILVSQSHGYQFFDLMTMLLSYHPGFLFIAHHVVIIPTSMYIITTGQFSIQGFHCGMMEICNPFIYSVFWMKKLEIRNRPINLINHLLLVIVWIFARLWFGVYRLLGFFVVNFGELKENNGVFCVSLFIFCSSVMSALQIAWFRKNVLILIHYFQVVVLKRKRV